MNLEQPIRDLTSTASRVATLAFLSQRLPATMMGAEIARSLAAETDAAIALIRLVRPTTGDTTTFRHAVDFVPSGAFPLPNEIPRTDAGYYFLTIGDNGELYRPEWIASLVEQLRKRFRYVLIESVADQL